VADLGQVGAAGGKNDRYVFQFFAGQSGSAGKRQGSIRDTEHRRLQERRSFSERAKAIDSGSGFTAFAGQGTFS